MTRYPACTDSDVCRYFGLSHETKGPYVRKLLRTLHVAMKQGGQFWTKAALYTI